MDKPANSARHEIWVTALQTSPFLAPALSELVAYRYKGPFTLLDALASTRSTQCSNDLDKVYAPLPYSADADAVTFAVSYTKSKTEVYIDVIRDSLHRGQGLHFLAHVASFGHDHIHERLKTREIPPWVPDWSDTWRIHVLSLRNLSDHSYIIKEPDACPGTNTEAVIIVTELHLTGVTLDEITVSTTVCPASQDVQAVLEGWRVLLEAYSSENIDDCFDRVCRAGHDSRDPQSMEPDQTLWPPEAREWGLEGNLAGSRRELKTLLCQLRKAGRTRGNSLGLFPGGAAPGDLVAAFCGGKTLYVLRPAMAQPGKYQFIGECYVDGMMSGEAMELCATRGMEPKTIVLV